MAKNKGNQFLIALLCTDCGAQNYLGQRNKINHPEKLKFKKYCKWCKKAIMHKESTKLR